MLYDRRLGAIGDGEPSVFVGCMEFADFFPWADESLHISYLIPFVCLPHGRKAVPLVSRNLDMRCSLFDWFDWGSLRAYYRRPRSSRRYDMLLDASSKVCANECSSREKLSA
jgi:hypothetical protein